MFDNENIILPFQVPNWKYVVKYITEINNNYEKIKSISDIINTLRQIKYLFDGKNSNEYFQDSFIGLGVFLGKYINGNLQHFIKNNLRYILYYVQMVETLVDHNLGTLSFKNSVVKLNLAAMKSLVACSVICIMPLKIMKDNGGSPNQIVNVNFDELFKAINFGSQNHVDFFNSILHNFSNHSLESLDKEINTPITISLHGTDCNHSTFHEAVTSWPIILTCDMSTYGAATDTVENMWPTYFDNFHLSNYSNQLAFKPEQGLCSDCPFFVTILPMITLGSADLAASSIIKISIHGRQHTLYRIQPLDHWCPDLQFSLRYIERNIINSQLAFQCVLKRNQPADSVFASSLTDSVIEDAINKLNWSKTREAFASNRSHSHFVDSRKLDRPSFPNIFFLPSRPRDSSISSSCSTSRSARQSYSASSSSRSGSLQLSSLSSRRSSNKDPDVNASADKPDFTGHGCHPIILEESNIQIDDDECLLVNRRQFQEFPLGSDCLITESQFKEMMSAPISDSIKLSLSKDYLPIAGEKSPEINWSSKRRNSSPIFGTVISHEAYKSQFEITKSETKPANRCCEADASNDRLSHIMWARSNNCGRRQSLPCHLHWVYGLPLTDSVKLDLSRSQMLANDINEDLGSDSSNRLAESSNDEQVNAVKLANDILDQILLNEDRRDLQLDLRREILNYRSRILDAEAKYDSNQQPFVTFYDSLHDNDLTLFYEELCTTEYFDDEAMEYFRNFSYETDPHSIFHPILSNVISPNTEDDNHENKIVLKATSPMKNVSLINYATQLTNTIIAEAIFQGSTATNSSPIAVYNRYADVISVDIIAGSLAELASRKKAGLKSISHMYIRPFPFCYRADFTILIQLLSACIAQNQIGQKMILVCDRHGDSDLSEFLEIINKNGDQLTPYRVYDAMLKYFSNSKTRNEMKFKEFLLKLLN